MSYNRFFCKPYKKTGRKSGMNKSEEKYAALLESMKQAGDIIEYVYEGITLKLADNTRYTPDFVVISDEYVTLVEVKARWNRGKENEHTHWEDDARVKWKVAMERYWWFRFAVVYHDKQSGWKTEYKN